jgi:DNA-binding transcriptional MerR regulator
MDYESKHEFSTDAGSFNVPHDVRVPEGDSFTIAELADAFGITTRALRFYEDHQLLRPERRGQARIYTRADFARLAWVLRGKRIGFALADIKELLDLYDVSDGRARQRAKTLEKCQERLSALKSQRDDLDHMITELSNFCTTLETVTQNSKSKA